jgi:hypothetical protein
MSEEAQGWTYYERALAVYQETGRFEALSRLLQLMGNTAVATGEYRRARDY